MEGEKKIQDSKNKLLRSVLTTVAVGSGLLSACKAAPATAEEKQQSPAVETESVDEKVVAELKATATEIPSAISGEKIPIELVTPEAAASVQEFPSVELDKPVIEAGISQAEVEFLASHEFGTGDTSRNVIMLTYDDGGTDYDIDKVMDAVERYNGKVTFFVPGEWLVKHPEMAKEIVVRGHLLECHGWDHANMATLTEEELRQQIGDFIKKMAEIVPGYEVKFIRFPYGSRNDLARQVAAEYGLQSVMWGVESGGKDDNTYNYVVDRAYWGSIVLSHTTRAFDMKYVEKIINTLANQGYTFETVEAGRSTDDVWSGSAAQEPAQE